MSSLGKRLGLSRTISRPTLVRQTCDAMEEDEPNALEAIEERADDLDEGDSLSEESSDDEVGPDDFGNLLTELNELLADPSILHKIAWKSSQQEKSSETLLTTVFTLGSNLQRLVSETNNLRTTHGTERASGEHIPSFKQLAPMPLSTHGRSLLQPSSSWTHKHPLSPELKKTPSLFSRRHQTQAPQPVRTTTHSSLEFGSNPLRKVTWPPGQSETQSPNDDSKSSGKRSGLSNPTSSNHGRCQEPCQENSQATAKAQQDQATSTLDTLLGMQNNNSSGAPPAAPRLSQGTLCTSSCCSKTTPGRI